MLQGSSNPRFFDWHGLVVLYIMLIYFYLFEVLNIYAFISGYGEFAELDKFTRAVAGEESYPNCEPLWTQLHQENKFTKQSLNIHDGISSMQLFEFKVTIC